jgi:uncharacterized membrane protein YbhN (UPF0104 family)
MTLVLCAGAALLAAIFWIQRRGLFASLLAVAKVVRVRFAFLEKRREKILEVDQAITGFYRNHRPRFYASTGMYLVGWLLDTTEIYLVSHLLGMPIDWTQALAIEAFTGVAKMLGMWIPGSIGVQESGIVLLGRLAGVPENLAVAYALLRRAREIIFAAVGWLLLYTAEASPATLRAESPSVTRQSPCD